MQKLVFTNGGGQSIDLTSGNFGITNWEGLSGVGLNIQTQQVPFQDGGVFLDALMEQREISVTVAIQDNNDLSARYERKRELISALNPKLGEGVLVYTNDFLSRQIKAVPQLPIFENKNSNDSGTLKASVVFSCPSPYWEDLEDTVVELNGMSIVQNNGDIPSPIKLTIPAGTNYPVIRNQQNGKLIALNGNFGENIEIDTNSGNKSVVELILEYEWQSGGRFNAVAFGGGKFVFVGEQIVVYDIYTGEYKTVNYSLSGTLYDVKYINNKFFIVGYQTLITSTDGINWVNADLQLSGRTLKAITYGDGMYLVMTDTTRYYTSTDGENWTLYNTSNYFGNDITFGNGLFVKVATSGSIETSSDGENWTTQTSGVSQTLNTVIYGEGKFIAGGNSGTIITSSDGIAWETQTSGTTNRINDILYNNGLFIAIGVGGVIITSSNGITWFSKESGTTYSLNTIAFGNGIYIITGENGIELMSNNCNLWNIVSEPTNIQFSSLAYGKGLFIGVGINGGVYSSTDGAKWDKIELGIENSLTSIKYEKNTFMIVGASIILISEDGVIWKTSNFSGTNFEDITRSENLYVAISSRSCFTSTDGENWTSRPTGASSDLRSITYGNSLFVAVGKNGVIYTTPDGIAWTLQTSGTNNWVNKIIYGNNLFIAVASYGEILTSQDGTGWTLKTIAGDKQLSDVIWADNMYYVVGDFGCILKSFDGNNWEEVIIGSVAEFNYIEYGNNMFILYGSARVLYISKPRILNNIISSLAPQSDMTFNLEIGENNILFSDGNNRNATLLFRQKYIGV